MTSIQIPDKAGSGEYMEIARDTIVSLSERYFRLIVNFIKTPFLMCVFLLFI